MAVANTIRFSQKEVHGASNLYSKKTYGLGRATGDKHISDLTGLGKMFDKIDQCRLVETLNRLSIHENIIRTIKNIYREAKFRVVRGENKSDFHEQNSGIRQGCPLSPYLFCIIMTAIFHDIKSVLNTPKQKEPIPRLHYAEILYADDTLIFGTHTHSINKLLHQIQQESQNTT